MFKHDVSLIFLRIYLHLSGFVIAFSVDIIWASSFVKKHTRCIYVNGFTSITSDFAALFSFFHVFLVFIFYIFAPT